MGFRVSWVACKGWDVATLIAKTPCMLGEEEPMKDGVYAVKTDDGVALLAIGVDHFGLVTWEMAKLFSEETDVLYFAANDEVMVSGLSAVKDGAEVWRVVCDASKGAAPAKTTGSIPTALMAFVSQAKGDGYGVAGRMAESLTGLHHRSMPLGTRLLLQPDDEAG